MKWNSLPTSAIYAPVRKKNCQGWLLKATLPNTKCLKPYGLRVGVAHLNITNQQTPRARKRNLQVRYIHAGIGADSLFDLHNQILTLKETIMSLKPLVEKNDDIEDQLSTHDSSLTFDEMEISSTDYQKLQEEYNKLIFQKHKV